MGARGATRNLAIFEEARRVLAAEGERCFQQRGVDALTLASAATRDDGPENSVGGVHAGQMIGERNAHGLWIGNIRQQAQKTARRLPHRVIAGPHGVGTIRAETRDRAPDEPGVGRAELLVTEPQALHRANAKVLDHDIGGQDQRPRVSLALLALEIERHTFLVAVDRAKGRRILHAAPTTERVAPGWLLDLDNVGPHVAQQHAGIRPGDIIGEFDNANPVQGSRHCSSRAARKGRFIFALASSGDMLSCAVRLRQSGRAIIHSVAGGSLWLAPQEAPTGASQQIT